MTNYGKDFKALRELKGYSLTQVATAAELSKSTLSRFENGETQLALDKFIAAVNAMGLSLADFEQKKVDDETILLFDESKKEDGSSLPKQFIKIKDVYRAFVEKDLMTLLTIHEELSEQVTEERLIKILAKLGLSRLSLNLALSSEDDEFLNNFVLTKSLSSELLIYCLPFLDADLSYQVLENIDYSSIENKSNVVKGIVEVLNRALDDEEWSVAKDFGQMLAKLYS